MSVSEKKIAVVLAGCGVFDGSEIHEATCTLLNIAAQGASYQCFAPNIRQPMVVNHYTKAAEPDESRNVLTEAARIARGNIKSLAEFNPDQFDAVIFPGGQGAAKNLCDFAVKGAACDVNPDVEQALVIAYEKQMPIGAICIAPSCLPAAACLTAVKFTRQPARCSILPPRAQVISALPRISDSRWWSTTIPKRPNPMNRATC